MIIRCPLCQYEIDASDRGCRTGCPMGKSCSLVCCPRCRYSFPLPESKIVNFVRTLLPKGKDK
ncbi:MAG: hypothetical protein M1550_03315 [Deltaproteobacteria bacterium]|nr:hypothetical protein [Deltaproteobacteria bacterium]